MVVDSNEAEVSVVNYLRDLITRIESRDTVLRAFEVKYGMEIEPNDRGVLQRFHSGKVDILIQVDRKPGP